MCHDCEPHFHADEINVVHEDGVLYGGLAGTTADGEESYLMLQLADEFDTADRGLGMDTFYVELDDQGASGYGGIAAVEVRTDCVHIHLTDKGMENLGVQAELCISFDDGVDPTTVAEQLTKFLSRNGVPVSVRP